MDIEFDPEKDALNKARHGGIGLAAAQEFDMDTALVALDDRQDYGEDRWSAVGFIGAELHVLIFTERAGRIRPIRACSRHFHDARCPAKAVDARRKPQP